MTCETWLRTGFHCGFVARTNHRLCREVLRFKCTTSSLRAAMTHKTFCHNLTAIFSSVQGTLLRSHQVVKFPQVPPTISMELTKFACAHGRLAACHKYPQPRRKVPWLASSLRHDVELPIVWEMWGFSQKCTCRRAAKPQ